MEVKLKTIFFKIAFYVKIYICLVCMYIKTRTQYREDLIIGFGGMLIRLIINILSIKLIFHNIDYIGHYTQNHIYFLYGLSVASSTIAETFFVNIWYLSLHINKGDFIKYRLRPISSLFYYFSETIEFKSITQQIIAIPLIYIFGKRIGINWSLEQIFFMIALMVVSSIIVVEIYICFASLSFWIIDAAPLLDFAQQLIDYSRYPVNIFGGIFRGVFWVITPIAWIAYVPMRLMIGEVSMNMLFLIIAVALLFGIFTSLLWCNGIKRYGGTGS